MATHSRIVAWKIPWAEEPGGLKSIGSPRIGQKKKRERERAREKKFFPILYKILFRVKTSVQRFTCS